MTVALIVLGALAVLYVVLRLLVAWLSRSVKHMIDHNTKR